MKYRSIRVIKQEIKEIINLITPLKDYLIDNPEDLAVILELKSFQKRINELNIELMKIESDN